MRILFALLSAALLIWLSPAVLANNNHSKHRPTESEEVPARVADNPAIIEERIVRLVEEGHVREAQAEAKGSGLSGAALTRISGVLLFAVGQGDSALPYLKQAHQAAPADVRMALYLAEVLCWKKDFSGARSLVDAIPDKTVAAQPRPWEPALHKARVLGWLHEFAGAKVLYTRVLEIPAAPAGFAMQARIRLAELAAWEKDLDGALRLLKPVLASTPGNVEATLVRGQILEWQQNYKDARGSYLAALQLHPNDAHLRWRLEKLSWVK